MKVSIFAALEFALQETALNDILPTLSSIIYTPSFFTGLYFEYLYFYRTKRRNREESISAKDSAGEKLQNIVCVVCSILITWVSVFD